MHGIRDVAGVPHNVHDMKTMIRTVTAELQGAGVADPTPEQIAVALKARKPRYTVTAELVEAWLRPAPGEGRSLEALVGASEDADGDKLRALAVDSGDPATSIVLRDALCGLPDVAREILIAVVCHEEKLSTVAARYGISPRYIPDIVRKAKGWLRWTLAEAFGVERVGEKPPTVPTLKGCTAVACSR